MASAEAPDGRRGFFGPVSAQLVKGVAKNFIDFFARLAGALRIVGDRRLNAFLDNGLNGSRPRKFPARVQVERTKARRIFESRRAAGEIAGDIFEMPEGGKAESIRVAVGDRKGKARHGGVQIAAFKMEQAQPEMGVAQRWGRTRWHG